MRTSRWITPLVSFLLVAGMSLPGAEASVAPAGAPPSVEPDLTQDQLLDAILSATGPDDAAARDRRARAVQHELDAIVARFGHRPPSYRRARKLHNLLHQKYLRSYDPDADRLDGIVRAGRYNCVSGVLFYGLAARALGYRPEVLAYPGHVLLRIRIGQRKVDIETTSPYGYDVGWLLHPSRHGSDRTWLHPEVGQRPADSHRYGERGNSVWLVPFDKAVGFAWINEAWSALAAGEAVRAAQHVLEARRYLPELERAEGVRRLIVRAFRAEYESGRFDAAYRIASADVELFPESTTSRDRVVAAALKRIEAACDRDDPRLGVTILDEVERGGPETLESRQLVRRTTPLIAAAAVRVGDWPLARAAAERHASVEPDPVEAARLRDWVEQRGAATLQFSSDPTCAAPLPILQALPRDSEAAR